MSSLDGRAPLPFDRAEEASAEDRPATAHLAQTGTPPEGGDPSSPPSERFGRVERVEWRTPNTETERALLAAAINQHNLARGIRTYRKRIGMTTETLAASIGRSPDHLRKILRGAAHITLTDLHLIAAAIDSRIEANIKVGRDQPRTTNSPKPQPPRSP